MAGVLAAGRVEPGRPVATLFEHSAWAIVCILAVLKAGSFYVPLDPRQPVKRLKALFRDADAPVLLCDAASAALARSIAPVESVLPVLQPATGGGVVRPAMAVAPDDPACVLYTSGSTGEPKGVIQTHRNLLFDLRRFTHDFRVTCDDRLALLYFPWFSASIGPMFGALLNGASVHVHAIAAGHGDLADWLRGRAISICDLNLAAFRQMTTGPRHPAFPSLRVLGLGGERVTRLDFDRFRRGFAPGTVLQNGYGATETRTISHCLLTHDSVFAGDTVPVGRPVEGKEVRLLGEDGQAVADGDIGEITVRSRYLSPGYWRRPELTQAAFRDGSSGERSYRTGDLGRWIEDGCLLHLGRKDAQVKVRGHRIELADVEAALLRLDGGRESAVTVHHDARDDAYLVGYFVPAGDPPGVASLRSGLAADLPAYMVPRRLVVLDALPRLANGKVDLRRLAEVGSKGAAFDRPFVAPRDALESRIAALAEDVLGAGPLGVDDDFLDLGCDSLNVAELLTALRQTLQAEVSPEAFFRTPTVAGLAQAVRERAAPAATVCVVPIHPEGFRPPLFCVPENDGQAGHWVHLARCLGPDQPVYALRVPPLGGTPGSAPTLSAIGARLAADIRLTVSSDQVVHLFGYSLGGIVAHECARQLAMSGQPVGPLILVDPRDLGAYRRAWQFLLRASDALCRGQAIALRRAARPAPAARNSGAASSHASDGPADPAVTERETAIPNAVRTHVPQPFPGSAVIFVPSHPASWFLPLWMRLWQPLVRGGIELRTVPGDHLTVVRWPQIEVLARGLRQVLDRRAPAGLAAAPARDAA